MKRLLKNLLSLLVLAVCATSQIPVVAHLRLVPPATQATLCSPNLQIESVKYLGKNNGKDSVQVIFNGQKPTSFSNFNNASAVAFAGAATSCVSYGVPPINSVGLGSGLSNGSPQAGIFGIGGITPNQGYEVIVTITRKFGHQDTGTIKGTNTFSGLVTTVVQIPRAAAETDPVKYDVTINTTFGGVTRRILTAQGNGAPALATATQTFANSSLVPLPDSCFPSVSITSLSFTPGSGATPDTITVNWTADRSPSDCFRLGVFISVEVKRADNSTGRAGTQPTANSLTLSLSGAPAAPVSFIVRVSAETRLGQQVQVNQKGEF